MRVDPAKAPARPSGSRRTAPSRCRSRRARGRSTRRGRCCAAGGSAPSPTTTTSVSAEKGYLKETGNLVFHLAADLRHHRRRGRAPVRLEGRRHRPGRQDVRQHAGPLRHVQPRPAGSTRTSLSPFQLTVDQLDATFEETVTGRGQFGQPRDFTAHVTTTATPGAADADVDDQGQPPAGDGGCRASSSSATATPRSSPCVTPRATRSTAARRRSSPRTTTTRPSGSIKVTGAQPKQLGFSGLFLPTATIDKESGPISVFPDAKKPALALTVYEGDLFPGGRPQSVYVLDTAKMTQLKNDKGDPLRIWLEPGQTYQLPGGAGQHQLRRRRAVRRAVDPPRPRQVRHPGRGAARPGRPDRLAGGPAAAGVRAGFPRAGAGSYRGSRRRPRQGRRRRAPGGGRPAGRRPGGRFDRPTSTRPANRVGQQMDARG